jgi:3-phosphoshikimate 1-carboxyvinyltransferase
MSPSLSRRPIKPVLGVLEQLGAKVNNDDALIEIHGRGFSTGSVKLPGNISSQFVSGFLMAAPRANGGTLRINVESPLESQPYVRLTLQALARHGIQFSHSSDLRHFTIQGSQEFRAAMHEIPGDYSSASFLVAASCATRSRIGIDGLPEDPLQADSRILQAAEEMGAAVSRDGHAINIHWADRVRPIELDARHSPDIVPAVAAMACFADGESKISGVHRLRIKESDRIESIVSEFAKLGGEVMSVNGEIVVRGPAKLQGTEVDSHGDHRIAMALAVSGLAAQGTTRILGAECVSKSYPAFFEDLQRLGAGVKF